MSRSELAELAPAKLTLALRVDGLRADGYHRLEALVATVSEPADRVILVPRASGIELHVGGPAARDVPSDASNLAWRAAAACGVDVAITLVKSIPAGAGLGGGSADAAAVLRALGGDRLEVAAELGSDVPFCLRGGLAWMRGRGEVVESIDSVPPIPTVIAIPPFPMPTPAVYRAWDEMGSPRARRVVPPPPAVAHLVPELVNDLEPAAERVDSRVRDFREALERLAGRRALLAGSGSAYAMCLDDIDAARALAASISSELGGLGFAGLAG